jgi:tRNA1Val (adenine37-N6)-methyltransferase
MSVFHFRHFDLIQSKNGLKMNTDSMLLGVFTDASKAFEVFDFGAGTGVLSLMLAQRFPEIRITAIELDVEDAQVAESNFQNSPWSNRLSIICGDLFELAFSQNKAQLVICNPPYFLDALTAQSQGTNRVKHSDTGKLKQFLQSAFDFTDDNGTSWFILPAENAQVHTTLFEKTGWFIQQEILIFPKPEKNCVRIIYELGKSSVNKVQYRDFIIRNNDHSYSEAYVQLTKAFHGKDLHPTSLSSDQ